MSQFHSKPEGSILGALNLNDRFNKEKILNDLKHWRSITLSKYNTYEPIRNALEWDKEGEVLEAWTKADTLLLRSAQGSVLMFNLPQFLPTHCYLGADFAKKEANFEIIQPFVTHFGGLLDLDFGFVHQIVEGELKTRGELGHVFCLDPTRQKYTCAVSSRTLSEGLPDLFFYTLLGKPYVQMFGEDRIATAPAYRIERLSGDMFGIQLAPSLEHYRDHYEEVARNRFDIQRHLGIAAFKSSGLADSDLRIPELRLQGPHKKPLYTFPN